jgi:hypothetical protein
MQALRMTARHHLALARLAVADNDAQRVGVQLASVVANLRAAMTWSGRALDPDAVKELDRIDAFAKQLQGEGATLDELADKALVDTERMMNQ